MKRFVFAISALVISFVILGYWLLSKGGGKAVDPVIACQERLQVIADGCAAYATANGGQAPPSLGALISGNFVQDEDLLSPDSVNGPGTPDKAEEWSHYRLATPNSTAGPGERIVAYCIHKDKDRVVVVYDDKKTATMSVSDFNSKTGK